MADAFSLIQFKDLPTFTGTLSENATLVAVLDNTRTVRIDWDILNSGLIRGSADQPSSPSDLGEQGNLYVGPTGLYSYSDGSWGKSPRYTENWDDLVPGVRFLRVDGSQSLSSTEKSRTLENIGLTIASTESAGLVKAWDRTAVSKLKGVAPVLINLDGTQCVDEATELSLGVVSLSVVATRAYVDDRIAESIVAEDLPIATAEVAGVVLSDTPLENGDGVFTVGENGKVTIRPASLYSYDEIEGVNKGGLPGIYSVTAIDDVQALSYAPTLGLVKTLVESAGGLNEVPVATTASVGGVKAWTSNSSPVDAAKVIIDVSGRQSVPAAEPNVTGAVRVVTTGADVTDVVDAASSYTVPTVSAVYSFVSTNFLKLSDTDPGKVSVSALPLATGSTVGVIKGSNTVNIDNEGAASVPDAAVNSKGVVMLAEVDNSGEFVANSGVTTATQVRNYVASKLTAGALSGLYVSKETYLNNEAINTDLIFDLRNRDAELRSYIDGVDHDVYILSERVDAVESVVDALQQAKGSEVLLNVASPTVTAASGWVKYTGSANSTVTFTGVAPTGYASTLTFQTEVPVTFGGTILWDKDEAPYFLPVAGYVFQITSFPGATVKLGRKVMEYKPEGAIYLKPAEGATSNANVRGFSFASSAAGFLRGVGFKQRSDNNIPTTNIPLWCKIWINDVFAGLSTNSVSMQDTSYPFYTFNPIEVTTGDVLKVMFFKEEGISSTSISDTAGSIDVGTLCYAKPSTEAGGLLGTAGQLTNSAYVTAYECRLSST